VHQRAALGSGPLNKVSQSLALFPRRADSRCIPLGDSKFSMLSVNAVPSLIRTSCTETRVSLDGKLLNRATQLNLPLSRASSL
jgi:hypothetical protein